METTLGGRTGPSWVRGLQTALVVSVVAYTISALPGVRPASYDGLLDGWLQSVAFLLAAAVAIARPIVTPRERTGWWLLAAGVLLRAAGVLVAVTWLRTQTPTPYPSVVDAGSIGADAVLLVVLALRVRAHQTRFLVTLLLDSAIAALTAGAVFVVVLGDALGGVTAPGDPSEAVATRLVCTVADIALVVMALGLVIVARGRVQVADGLLCVGVAALAVMDVLQLARAGDGDLRPEPWLAALTLVATAVLAWSAWAPDREVGPEPSRRPPGLLVPAFLALFGIGTLLYGDLTSVPLTAVVLATASLLVAIVRALLTLAVDRDFSGRELGAANDETLQFQALVEASSDFIAISDAEGRVLYINPGGRKLLGLSARADVRGMPVSEFVAQDDREGFVRERYDAMRERGEASGEGFLRHIVTGRAIPVTASSFAIRDRVTGEPYAFATVQRDMSERQAAEESLRLLIGQRQRLMTRLVQAQDEERTKIASDVHDDSVQALAAVDLRLSMVRQQMEKEAPALLEATDKALESVRAATSRLRHLLFDLESPARRGRLSDAVSDAAYYLFEDTSISWKISGDTEVDLPEAERVTAYRVVKEALANVRKHAQASSVGIDVIRRSDGLVVSVWDDGRGIEPGQDLERPGHLGLSSMRDRAEVAGGTLIVRPRREGGTEVRLWLPDGV